MDTLAGWITHHIRQMPKLGRKLELSRFSLEVLEVSKHRIELVKVMALEHDTNTDS